MKEITIVAVPGGHSQIYHTLEDPFPHIHTDSPSLIYFPLRSTYHLLTYYTFYLFILLIVCFFPLEVKLHELELPVLFTAVSPAPKTLPSTWQVLSTLLDES